MFGKWAALLEDLRVEVRGMAAPKSDFSKLIAKEILHELQLVYFAPPTNATQVSWSPKHLGVRSRTEPGI